MILRLLLRLFRPLMLKVLNPASQLLWWFRMPGGRTVLRRQPVPVPVRIPARQDPRGPYPHVRR
jgi:hypothetical protein